MKERMGAEHYGVERQETMEAQAEAIVAEELKRRRWKEEELGRRAKGGRAQGGDGGATAGGDGDDGEMDRGAGCGWEPRRYVHHLLYRRRKEGRKRRVNMTISRTDPLLEKRHILAALERCKGNRTHAARMLDISIRTLRNKLHEYHGTAPKANAEEETVSES